MPAPCRAARSLHLCQYPRTSTEKIKSELTGRLLLTVTSDGANNGILLPANAVERAFGVTLGLRSFDLSFAGSVLLLARLRP